MAFKFIYGPNGTDKTAKCLSLMQSCLGKYEKIYYIVPENLSFSAEKKVADLFGGVSEENVYVSSFKKLYCDTVNITGERKSTKLSRSGIRILMSYLCVKHKNELVMLKGGAESKGFAEIMSGIVQEFKAYGVTSQMLLDSADKTKDVLGIKIRDIVKIYQAYEQFMEKGFSDVQDEMDILKLAILENEDIYKNSLFVFDGFQVYTPGEYGVISAIAKKSDMAFAITTDCLTENENDMYLSQKQCVGKIRKTLSEIDEKESVKAEFDDRFENMPENKTIYDTLVLGNMVNQKKSPVNLEVHEFEEQYKETEYVAKQITKLVEEGARYRDIFVVARDSDRYLPVISTIFNDYEIPVFFDKKMDGEKQPALNAVLSALEIINENFSYESVFTYLKTGFSNLDSVEIDLLDNYILATGIRGTGWFKDWKYTPYIAKASNNSKDFLKEINLIREKTIKPVITLKDALSRGETVKEKTQALFLFLKEIDLYEKISGMIERFKLTDTQTAAYYGRVWNILISTMDEIVTVIGDEKTTTEEFISLFSLGVSMHDISIVPTNNDVVTVISPETLSENPQKYVFVIGANDGVYPMVSQNEGILCDKDREALKEMDIELGQTSLEKIYDENYIIAKTFLSAKCKLYITYPIGDIAGGTRFISNQTARIIKAFGEYAPISHIVNDDVYSEDEIIKPKPTFDKLAANLRKTKKLSEKWQQAYDWYKQEEQWKNRVGLLEKAFEPVALGLSEKITEKLYSDGLKVSVSSLEQYVRCPFAHYANYILKLKPRETVDISVADTGSIMHEAIETLSNSIVKNGFSWKTVSEEFLNKEIVKIIDKSVISLEEKFDKTSATQLALMAKVKGMLEQSVKYIAEHLRAGEFEPLGYEIGFGEDKEYADVSLEVFGKKVKLRGKVDRADIYYDKEGRKYIRVIDYKSGEKNFDFSATYYGLQMQLIVYLNELCNQTDSKPAGVLYFRLFDPVVEANASVSNEELDGKISKLHQMSGIVLADKDVVLAMDKEAADSRIIPVKINKNGEFSDNSHILTSMEFKSLQKHINDTIKKLSKSILSGDISISPYRQGDKTGCDYCDFKSICLFDGNCGGKYNEMDIDKEEAFDLIMKAGEEIG